MIHGTGRVDYPGEPPPSWQEQCGGEHFSLSLHEAV